MKYIEVKAPAKINIGLHIINKRNDGFHNLHTLFYPIYDLYDTLKFTLADRFDFICDNNSIPTDDNNLVVKTKLLLEKFSNRKLNVKIELIKRIPTQAGLGGGSSDAAATLVSLNEVFNLHLNFNQISELALQLGSDVPFFIKSKPAIGKLRGEILEYIDLEIDKYIVIVKPEINISTKEAFTNCTLSKNEIDYEKIISKNNIDFELLKKLATNDFEAYVFSKYPEIESIKNKLYMNGALYASMSGSGSTVFGIFNNLKDANNSIITLPKKYFYWISTPRH